MPTAGTTRANVANLLKINYEPEINTQFTRTCPLMEMFLTREESLAEGEKIAVHRHVGGGDGIGWASDEDPELVPPGSQVYERAYFNLVTHYNRIGYTRKMMISAVSPKAAVREPWELAMRDALRDIKEDLGFNAWGDGTGSRGQVSSATAGASTFTITVRTNRNQFRRGQKYDVLVGDTGAVDAGFQGYTVLSYNRSTGVVTFSVGSGQAALSAAQAAAIIAAASATTTEYRIYRHKSRNNVCFGLSAAVSRQNPGIGNYGQVNRTTAGNDDWLCEQINNISMAHGGSGGSAANVTSDDITGAAPSAGGGGEATTDADRDLPRIETIAEMIDQIETNADDEVTHLTCDHEINRYLIKLALSDKRWPGEVVKFELWGRGTTFMDRPIIPDRFAIPNRIYALSKPTFRWAQDPTGGKWIDDDGNIIRNTPETLKFEAIWARDLQLLCRNPSNNGFLYNVKGVV